MVDSFDREELYSALVYIQPDVVIHQLTSLSNWNFEDNTRIRIKGTCNLGDAARAQLGEIVQLVRDGRLRTNIGNVASLDDAVAAFNPTERIKGKDDHPRSSVRAQGQ